VIRFASPAYATQGNGAAGAARATRRSRPVL